MNSPARAGNEVPVDVLPPDPYQPRAVGTGGGALPVKNQRHFYHALSGVVILGIDWLAFGTDALTGMLALPEMCVLAFIVSYVAIMAIQTRLAGDTKATAMKKAFLGAFLVGLPLPITGTMLGAGILALSGLPHHPLEMVKRLLASRGPAR
jgi:hypothetical protein